MAGSRRDKKDVSDVKSVTDPDGPQPKTREDILQVGVYVIVGRNFLALAVLKLSYCFSLAYFALPSWESNPTARFVSLHYINYRSQFWRTSVVLRSYA